MTPSNLIANVRFGSLAEIFAIMTNWLRGS